MKITILQDKQGNVVSEGDKIMYITDGPRVNYGTVISFDRVKPWGYEHWSIKVLKTAGSYHEKDRIVYLTEPTIFKCGVALRPVP